MSTPRSVVRTRAARNFGLSLGLIFGLLALSGVFAQTTPSPGHPAHPVAIGWRVFDVALGLASFWFFAVRFGLSGVYVEDDGLRVRNLLTTVRIPWTEVEGVTIARRPSSQVMALVCCTGGARVWALGLQRVSVWGNTVNRSLRKAVDDLNARIAEERLRRGLPASAPAVAKIGERPPVARALQAFHSAPGGVSPIVRRARLIRGVMVGASIVFVAVFGVLSITTGRPGDAASWAVLAAAIVLTPVGVYGSVLMIRHERSVERPPG